MINIIFTLTPLLQMIIFLFKTKAYLTSHAPRMVCSLGVSAASFSELGHLHFFILSFPPGYFSPLSLSLFLTPPPPPPADLTCAAGNKQTPSAEGCSPLACHCLLHWHGKFTVIQALCSLSISIRQAEIIITMETTRCSSQSRALIPNSEQMYSYILDSRLLPCSAFQITSFFFSPFSFLNSLSVLIRAKLFHVLFLIPTWILRFTSLYFFSLVQIR